MKKEMIKPQALTPGDTIGIAAIASPFDKMEFEKGVKTLEDLGFKVKFNEGIFSKQNYLAGSDARRAEELNGLFLDPKVKAIFFARGGYGTLRILPLLQWNEIQKYPKIVLGYSDMTVLLNHLSQRFSWITFHGPVVAKGLGEDFQDRGKKALLKALTQSKPIGELKSEEIKYLKAGKAKAPLVGGCLSILVHSLKTPYEIETDGKILLIEDVGEKPYAIDRMLTQLRLAGKLGKIKGLVCGAFQDCGSSDSFLKEVITERLEPFDIPIVYGLPTGHTADMVTVPLGTEVTLDSNQQSICFAETAVGK